MDKIELKRHIENNLTIPQIAAETGKCETTVKRWLKKHGLKTNRHAAPGGKIRKCRGCGDVKDIMHFPVAALIGDKLYHRHKCDDCYVQMKSDRRRRIAAWIEGIKKTMKCVRCGNDDFRVLEFHHTDQNKSFNISDGVKFGLCKQKILQEIDKCDPMCANCHRILTYEERRITADMV